MAQLGIMAGTYRAPSLAQALDAIARDGLRAVQYGLPSTSDPAVDQFNATRLADVRQEFAARSLDATALAGTYNMAHPDPAIRVAGARWLEDLIRSCAVLGTTIVTLCTGTRDPEDMWRRHRANNSAAAWTDMVSSIQDAARIAEELHVTLAFEPEVNNVVDSARKARRLLDDVGSPALKVVMDPANLFHAGELPRMAEVLEEAFTLLGPDIALAHAKDLDHDGDAGHLPAGRGLLDYPRYLALLQQTGFAGAVILHGLEAEDVAGCAVFVRESAPAGFWS